jgi:hypothetical protein
MAYEIWDMQTGNLVASFGLEADALTLVRDAVETHGEPYARNLALVREDDDGTTATVAASDQLLKRVRVVTRNGTQAGPGRS